MELNEKLNGNLSGFFEFKIQNLGKKGLEPLTLRLSSVYSNQLSYLPLILYFEI